MTGTSHVHFRYDFNDSEVSPLSEISDPVVSNRAYILFYRRFSFAENVMPSCGGVQSCGKRFLKLSCILTSKIVVLIVLVS